MITLYDVSKVYRTHGGQTKVILDHFTGVFPTGVNVGILGHNGAGKSTLTRMLSGGEPPSSGEILREGRISWPLGFSGGFHGSLTGRQNLRLICDIYDVDYGEVVDFVEDFSGLGRNMDEQIRFYSSGMKARLAFGASMAIRFDYYLIDEVIAVGDTAFKEQCKRVLTERRKEATVLLVSHSTRLLHEFCDIGGVLDKGKLVFYDDLDEAVDVHEANMRASL
ncbi:ABC transporter ATP-binding protein, partial [Escherichia coli]|nr:ABC transporter ATP-binding protein [Escherichia coli]